MPEVWRDNPPHPAGESQHLFLSLLPEERAEDYRKEGVTP